MAGMQAGSIFDGVQAMLGDLEALYKDVHRHPELSMQERTLMAVFQPAEETAAGAQAMIDDGLFDRFRKPDVVLGQHVMPIRGEASAPAPA